MQREVPNLPILRGGNQQQRWEYNQHTGQFTKLWATTYLEWWSPKDGSGIWRKVRWTLRVGELNLVQENGVDKVMEVWDWRWADDEQMPGQSLTTPIEASGNLVSRQAQIN